MVFVLKTRVFLWFCSKNQGVSMVFVLKTRVISMVFVLKTRVFLWFLF